MKKIFFLLIILVGCQKPPVYKTDRNMGVTFQQVNVGASANDHTGDPLRTAFIKQNDNWTLAQNSLNNIYSETQTRTLVNDSLNQLRADATPLGDALSAYTEIFNVFDYGADPTGVLDSHAAIQDAIDAAHNYSLVTGMGGTVFIPAGSYKISGTMTLRSYMTVKAANNAYFLKFGTSAPFFIFEPTVNECTLDGGYYDCNGFGSFLADTITNGNYVQLSHFKNLHIINAVQTLSFRMEGDGWMNANTFSDIIVDQFVSFLKEVTVATGSFDGNVFNNIQLQAGTDIDNIIDNFDGSWNIFNNLLIWDFVYVADAGDFTIILGATANENVLIGAGLTNYAFQDLGFKNTIIDEGHVIIKPLEAALTDDTPTDTEIDSATGMTPATAINGYEIMIKDTNGSGLLYLIKSDGTNWQYTKLTIAVNP